MLQRYQNELLVLFALLVLLGAWLFQYNSHVVLAQKSIASTQVIAKLEDVATMKKLWGKNKKHSRSLEAIQRSLSKEKVKKFEIKKNKAHIILQNLNGTELNKIVGKQIASIPLQIIELSIDRNGDMYTLELRCKW